MFLNQPRALAMMEKHGIDALVAATTKNVLYASGYQADTMINGFFECSACVVLPRSQDIAPAFVVGDMDLPYFAKSPTWIPQFHIFDKFYFSPLAAVEKTAADDDPRLSSPELQREIRGIRQETRETSTTDIAAAVAHCLRELGLSGGNLGFDSLRLARVLKEQHLPDLKAVDAYDMFRQIRMVKTADEIQVMREGALINEKALKEAIAAARPGGDFAESVAAYKISLARAGAKALGERGIHFGPAEMSATVFEDWHHILQPGEAVVFDVIATYQQYCADMARTAVIGEPTREQVTLHEAVTGADILLDSLVKPGLHTHELEKKVREFIASNGADPDMLVVLSHCLGLDIFEFPGSYGREADGFVLEAGMAFNVEILQVAPQAGGAFHLEDTIVVTDDGCERFCDMPKDLIVV